MLGFRVSVFPGLSREGAVGTSSVLAGVLAMLSSLLFYAKVVQFTLGSFRYTPSHAEAPYYIVE